MKEDDLIIAFRLKKAGYGSNLQDVKEMSAREMVQAIYYEEFLADYETAFAHQNKGK